MKEHLMRLSMSMSQELDSILAFWSKETVDERQGGFYGEISSGMDVHYDAPKGLVLNARILWTFASACRHRFTPRYRALADRAYRYLLDYFLDSKHGGYYWSVDSTGEKLNGKKQIYGQAFVVYAFAEYYRATGLPQALEHAQTLFRLIEEKGCDRVHGGYFEAYAEDWSATDDYSLSSKDLNESKSMNTHLHVLEAYTNLYRIWPSDTLRNQLAALIDVTAERIVDPASGHFRLFFDDEWHVKSDHISYGHDIEGSWLLLEAAETLGEPELIARMQQLAVRMAEAVYMRGLDDDGALFNEAGPHGLIDDAKDWWPQAEAVVGFVNAYGLTNDERYLTAALRAWEFIERYMIDRVHGEWHEQLSRDRKPNAAKNKVDAWKCPYHNARACLEIIERAGALKT